MSKGIRDVLRDREVCCGECLDVVWIRRNKRRSLIYSRACVHCEVTFVSTKYRKSDVALCMPAIRSENIAVVNIVSQLYVARSSPFNLCFEHRPALRSMLLWFAQVPGSTWQLFFSCSCSSSSHSYTCLWASLEPRQSATAQR